MNTRLEMLESRSLLGSDGDMKVGQEHASEGDSLMHQLAHGFESMLNGGIAVAESYCIARHVIGSDLSQETHRALAVPVYIDFMRLSVNLVIRGVVSGIVYKVGVEEVEINNDYSPANVQMHREALASAFWQTYWSSSTFTGIAIGMGLAGAANMYYAQMKS